MTGHPRPGVFVDMGRGRPVHPIARSSRLDRPPPAYKHLVEADAAGASAASGGDDQA